MAHRINLNALPGSERQALRDLILDFLNDAVVGDHPSIVHSGVNFFTGHRSYLARLESFLTLNGGARFVPLPEWDPRNEIPAEFNVVDALDDGTARVPLANLTPNDPMPPEFAPNTVCAFETAEDLAAAVIPWHNGVHVGVGGTMVDFMQAPAAPIFWCWHALLDDIYFDWQACVLDPEVPEPEHGYEEYKQRKQIYEAREKYWLECEKDPDYGKKFWEYWEKEREYVHEHVPAHAYEPHQSY